MLFTNINGAADNYTVSGLAVTQVGAVVHLPLDEGGGLLLQDRSSNRLHAVASTSGVTHVLTKDGPLRVRFSTSTKGLIDQQGAEAKQISSLSSDKQGLLAETALLSARIGKYVVWAAIAGGMVFLLFHAGLFMHLNVRSTANRLPADLAKVTADHVQVQKQLADANAAHAAVKDQLTSIALAQVRANA